MFARDKLHTVKTHTVVIVYNVANLYESWPPEPGIETKVHKVRKPFLLQQCGGFGVLFSVLSHKAEILLKRLAFALPDTAGKVCIKDGISVNVIKPAAVRVLVVNSHLVGTAPVGNVLFGQGICLLEQLSRELEPLFA